MKTTDKQPVSRSRRMRRKGAVLLLLTACAAGWWQYLNHVPDISVPTPTMPSPNAFDRYVQAGNSLVNEGAVRNAITRDDAIRRQNRKPLTPEQKTGLLEANKPALETLRSGFALPYQHPPLRSFDVAFPYLEKFRSLARLLTLEAQMREANGDHAGAANSYLDAIRLGADIPRGGALIQELVGIACEAIGRRPLWALSEKLSADEAREAARRME